MNKKISMIACIGPNGILGTKDNKLPWKSKTDLKHFSDITKGKVCIFGDNTFFGLPKYPLKDRLNLVVSFDCKNVTVNKDGYIMFPTIEEALRFVNNYSEVVICGGAGVYKYCFNKGYINTIYLTINNSLDIINKYKEYDLEKYIYLSEDILNNINDLSKWKLDYVENINTEDEKLEYRTYIKNK